MSDRDDLPKRGIPFYAMIDETGIAVGGTSTQSILRGKDMEPICATDSSGVSNGVTANTLRQRGINFFCPVLETGLAADATTMNTLRQRGIPLFCAVSNVGVAQGGTLTIGQLAQRGIPYFCPLDENGTATTLGVLPTTPVLAITSLSTDNTPEFTIDFDNTVAAGDNMRLQVQVSGGDWSSLVSDTNHVITAPEDAANEIALALSALGNANYQARANVTHGATSAWSNIVAFTISVVSYAGPGDVVSGATTWVSSARAYSAAFAAGGTAIMDLQDQAGANPITINILTNGFADVSAITTWVAAHSVSTIRVAKLYDQTGNGNHFTQGTLATMPVLTLSSLNGLPGLTFASASNTTINTAAITFAQPFTMSGVYKRTAGVTGGNLLAGQAGAGVGFGPGTVANFASIFGPTEVTVAATENAFHALEGVFNAASSAVIGDGTVVTGNAGLGGISAALLRVGRSSAGNTLDGTVMEAGVWGTLAMTTGGGSQTALLNTNQHSAANGYNF